MINEFKKLPGFGPACATETSHKTIEVFDCYSCLPVNQRSYIRTLANQPVHFTLDNPECKKVLFVAVDNCLMTGAAMQRCDFIIGDLSKLFFVEIKQVGVSKRRDARKRAITQLASTIEYMLKHINSIATQLIAVICLNAKKVYPVQSASRAAEIVLFREKYNARLMEGAKAVA